MKYLILIIACLCLVACDPNKVTRERFGDNQIIVTDNQGNKYLLQHNIGSNYTITPMPKNFGDIK